ncbi:hypothetical protein K491DRAFT_784746 [Lophiostoma macrostomum CBS 122681]|uniref:Uncharacterized protein n=1 Tax=Lophiostoma macrostomum CBS 122681 TaxID=1314788 RepID=A0A6A6SM04_9PLEO|nr:hypothetical protein K491DRAFT_784746 [Lophiostoma macrostomum CBS 122681]
MHSTLEDDSIQLLDLPLEQQNPYTVFPPPQLDVSGEAPQDWSQYQQYPPPLQPPFGPVGYDPLRTSMLPPSSTTVSGESTLGLSDFDLQGTIDELSRPQAPPFDPIAAFPDGDLSLSWPFQGLIPYHQKPSQEWHPGAASGQGFGMVEPPAQTVFDPLGVTGGRGGYRDRDEFADQQASSRRSRSPEPSPFLSRPVPAPDADPAASEEREVRATEHRARAGRRASYTRTRIPLEDCCKAPAETDWTPLGRHEITAEEIFKFAPLCTAQPAVMFRLVSNGWDSRAITDGLDQAWNLTWWHGVKRPEIQQQVVDAECRFYDGKTFSALKKDDPGMERVPVTDFTAAQWTTGVKDPKLVDIISGRGVDEFPKGEDRGMLTAVLEAVVGLELNDLKLSDFDQVVANHGLQHDPDIGPLPADTDVKCLGRVRAKARLKRKNRDMIHPTLYLSFVAWTLEPIPSPTTTFHLINPTSTGSKMDCPESQTSPPLKKSRDNKKRRGGGVGGAANKRRKGADDEPTQAEMSQRAADSWAKIEALIEESSRPRVGSAQAEIASMRSRGATPQPSPREGTAQSEIAALRSPTEPDVLNSVVSADIPRQVQHQFEYRLDFLRAPDPPPSQNQQTRHDMTGSVNNTQRQSSERGWRNATGSVFPFDQRSPLHTDYPTQQKQATMRRQSLNSALWPQFGVRENMASPATNPLASNSPARQALSQLQKPRPKTKLEVAMERAQQELSKPPNCLVNLRPILFINLTPMEFKTFFPEHHKVYGTMKAATDLAPDDGKETFRLFDCHLHVDWNAWPARNSADEGLFTRALRHCITFGHIELKLADLAWYCWTGVDGERFPKSLRDLYAPWVHQHQGSVRNRIGR